MDLIFHPSNFLITPNQLCVLDTISTKRFVFIGGLHRSGTSILHRCIGDHPEVSNFSGTDGIADEGQHLQSVYNPANKYGGPGVFGFDDDSFLDESSDLATPENAKVLFDDWSEHWDLSKSILVEKSPPNLVRSRFLQSLFPASRFIFLVRHPIAVSYATQKWSGTSLYSLIRHWLVCNERMSADMKLLDRAILVKYEDFVSNPLETMRSIWHFIGLDEHPTEREIKSGINNQYFEKWNNLGGSFMPFRLYKKYILNKFESRTNTFGYTLEAV
jgi:hypothetical protein